MCLSVMLGVDMCWGMCACLRMRMTECVIVLVCAWCVCYCVGCWWGVCVISCVHSGV